MNALTIVPLISYFCYPFPAFLPALSVPFWLNKLHSEIWNRQDLKPKLFRKVEVTRAHYDALEDRLNQKYKICGDKWYHAKSNNVLSEKLAILETTPATTAI
jgi:hypothetical protein